MPPVRSADGVERTSYSFIAVALENNQYSHDKPENIEATPRIAATVDSRSGTRRSMLVRTARPKRHEPPRNAIQLSRPKRRTSPGDRSTVLTIAKLLSKPPVSATACAGLVLLTLVGWS